MQMSKNWKEEDVKTDLDNKCTQFQRNPLEIVGAVAISMKIWWKFVKKEN